MTTGTGADTGTETGRGSRDSGVARTGEVITEPGTDRGETGMEVRGRLEYCRADYHRTKGNLKTQRLNIHISLLWLNSLATDYLCPRWPGNAEIIAIQFLHMMMMIRAS